MSFGLLLITTPGQVINTSIIPGTVYDTLVVGGGATGSKAYPELAGFTIFASVQKYLAQPNALTATSVSYSAGYPVLNWFPSGSTAPTYDATIFVFAK